MENDLYYKWLRTEERKKVDRYEGKQLEEIPEEDRMLVERMRSIRSSQLAKAKQNRDEAKVKNSEARELEQQVSEELEKRGKNHEE